MLTGYFYRGSIRQISTVIGSLFNNIHVHRHDASGTLTKDITVPLSYESRAAYWSKLHEAQSTGDGIADLEKHLPRISYHLDSLTPDLTRQMSAMHQNISSVASQVANNVITQRNPVAYNLSYSINIFTKHIEDGLEIIEQIVPLFSPLYNITLKDPSGLGVNEDMPLVLEGIETDDNYKEGFEDNRVVSWTIVLTAKSSLYPIINNQSVIKTAITEISDQATMIPVIQTVTQTATTKTVVEG